MSAKSVIIGARLQTARTAAPYWPRNEMARLLINAAARLDLPAFPHVGTLADMIKKWERGIHVPGHKYRRAYCDVLGRSEEDLFAAGDASIAPMGTVPSGPFPDDWDDEVKRRTALQMFAALGAGTTIPPGVLEQALSGVERALGSSVDVAGWERTVIEYRNLIDKQPVGALINDLAADMIAVGELLNRDGAPRQDLLRISATLGGLLATEVGDIGDRRGARMAWNTARRAADASGDRDLRVWVRGREIQEAFWASAPPDVIEDLAAEALTIANGTPSPGVPRVHAARAGLAAIRKDVRSAHEALGMMNEVSEKLDPGLYGWKEANVHWNEAYVYTLIKDPRAERALSAALAHSSPGTLGPVANLHMIRAMGLVKERDVDTGLDQLLTMLHGNPVSPARRRIAGQALQALPEKARTLPAAREVRAITAAA
ncbi:XRE family transcriptional regulator [Actinomadura sp. 21ATH]|uniref:XRE family transcriptional regulator n=1 Tax=Actinomadura sp. 21ATH TaxID=1735444 RepID=UPI0035C02835